MKGFNFEDCSIKIEFSKTRIKDAKYPLQQILFGITCQAQCNKDKMNCIKESHGSYLTYFAEPFHISEDFKPMSNDVR